MNLKAITVEVDHAYHAIPTDDGRERMGCYCYIFFDNHKKIGFRVLAEFSYEHRTKSEQHAVYCTRAALLSYLPTINTLNLFQEHRIDVPRYIDDSIEAEEGSKPKYTAELDITESLNKSLLEQTPLFLKGQEYFKEAVEFLMEQSKYPQQKTKILQTMNFLQRLIHEDGNSYLVGWYREKHGLIEHYFKDLFGRKNTNHSGYKYAQDYIHRTLFSYKAPNVWLEEPSVHMWERINEKDIA